MLTLVRRPFPRAVFLVPLAWVIVGTQAALLFGMYEDLGLLAPGAAGAWRLLRAATSWRHA
jgi:hypothetical protein